MKGIADGAAAAGAKFDGRPLDLLDIVALNSEIEVEFLDGALDATPTGLEGRRFRRAADARPAPRPARTLQRLRRHRPGHRRRQDRLRPHHHVQPLHRPPLQRLARRQARQGAPRPDAVLPRRHPERHGLLHERRRPARRRDDHRARPGSTPTASRSPRASARPSSTPTRSTRPSPILEDSNNGLYTNEWLLADTKTNEIAMFELGTHKTRLWRSSKDEWFGGTKGFYWGCNNAKDLRRPAGDRARASTASRPTSSSTRPTATGPGSSSTRSTRARSTAGFGFEAFTTPPLAASPRATPSSRPRRWPRS